MEDQILVVKPRNVSPASPTRFDVPIDFAHWPLDENWFVRSYHICSKEKLWDWWPLISECTGRLVAEPVFNAREYFVNRLNGRHNRASLELSINGETGDAAELYDLLGKQGAPIVSVQGYHFELHDFHKLSHDHFIQTQMHAQAEIADDRLGILFVAAAILAGLTATFFALRWFYNRVPIIANSAKIKVKAKVATGVADALNAVQEIQIKRITREELIRQTAREVLADASDQERAEIRSQIQQAMDSGNQDLAATLSSVLRKIDKA